MKAHFLTSAILAAILAVASPAVAETSKTPDGIRLLNQATQRAKLMDCMERSVDKFDDRISPADVVASAVAWHCEADGNPNLYWVVLAQRRSTPDGVDVFYRDLALLFVLQARARKFGK